MPLPDLQVLAELVRERRASTAELSAVLQRTESETRHHLARVVEQGWVEVRGERRGRSWHLSAAVSGRCPAFAGAGSTRAGPAGLPGRG